MKTLLVSTHRDPESGRLMLRARCDGESIELPTPVLLALSSLDRAWYAAEIWLEHYGTDRDRSSTWAEGWTLDASGHGHYTFTRTDGRVFSFGLSSNPG